SLVKKRGWHIADGDGATHHHITRGRRAAVAAAGRHTRVRSRRCAGSLRRARTGWTVRRWSGRNEVTRQRRKGRHSAHIESRLWHVRISAGARRRLGRRQRDLRRRRPPRHLVHGDPQRTPGSLPLALRRAALRPLVTHGVSRPKWPMACPTRTRSPGPTHHLKPPWDGTSKITVVPSRNIPNSSPRAR